MKQFFFTTVLIMVPVVISGSILYMFFHGIYVVLRDWMLRKELREIEMEFQGRSPREAAPQELPEAAPKAIPTSGLGRFVDLDSLKVKEPTA